MATAWRLLLCLNEQFLVSQFFLKETKKKSVQTNLHMLNQQIKIYQLLFNSVSASDKRKIQQRWLHSTVQQIQREIMGWSQAEKEERMKLQQTGKRWHWESWNESFSSGGILEPRCFLKVNKQQAAIPTPASSSSRAKILELTDTNTNKLTEVIKMNRLWLK